MHFTKQIDEVSLKCCIWTISGKLTCWHAYASGVLKSWLNVQLLFEAVALLGTFVPFSPIVNTILVLDCTYVASKSLVRVIPIVCMHMQASKSVHHTLFKQNIPLAFLLSSGMCSVKAQKQTCKKIKHTVSSMKQKCPNSMQACVSIHLFKGEGK